MEKFLFDSLDNQNKNCIHFELLFEQLAKLTERSISDVGILFYRNYEQFKNKYPYSELEFNFYQYNPVTGFHTNADFVLQSMKFLYQISLNRRYYEHPQPGHEGFYSFDLECFSYTLDFEGFYFKSSEIYKFLRYIGLPIPLCAQHSADFYESDYLFDKAEIERYEARLYTEVDEKSIDIIESTKDEVNDLKDKSKCSESKKTTNSQAKLIKSLLYLLYKNFDLIDNPRSYIDNSKSEICTDFESLGLVLPSGKTVEKWLKDVDIDIHRE